MILDNFQYLEDQRPLIKWSKILIFYLFPCLEDQSSLIKQSKIVIFPISNKGWAGRARFVLIGNESRGRRRRSRPFRVAAAVRRP